MGREYELRTGRRRVRHLEQGLQDADVEPVLRFLDEVERRRDGPGLDQQDVGQGQEPQRSARRVRGGQQMAVPVFEDHEHVVLRAAEEIDDVESGFDVSNDFHQPSVLPFVGALQFEQDRREVAAVRKNDEIARLVERSSQRGGSEVVIRPRRHVVLEVVGRGIGFDVEEALQHRRVRGRGGLDVPRCIAQHDLHPVRDRRHRSRDSSRAAAGPGRKRSPAARCRRRRRRRRAAPRARAGPPFRRNRAAAARR